MKNILFAILLQLLCWSLLAQPKYYEKEIGWGIGQSAGHAFFLNNDSLVLGCGGITLISSAEKVFLVFADQFLQNITVNAYGGDTTGYFVILDMIETPFGYAFCGWLESTPTSGSGHPYLVELDRQGTVLNFYDLQDSTLRGNAVTLLYYPETNTYYIGGNAYDGFPQKLMLIKITNGIEIWRRYYDNYTERNLLIDLLPADDGGCYAVGNVDIDYFNTSGNSCWFKIDTAGNITSERYYNFGDIDYILESKRTNNGDFALAGQVSKKAHLTRIDSTGDTIRFHRSYFPTSYLSEMSQVRQVGNDFVGVGVVLLPTENNLTAYIMKVNGINGLPIWTRYYDMNVNSDYFYNFTVASDGGFLCVGRTEPEGLANAYVVRTNCRGTLDYPRAQFSLSVNEEGDIVTVTNQSDSVFGYEPDGGHFELDFGDGSPPAVFYNPNTNYSHSYNITQLPQTYTVTLRAILCSDTATYTQIACFGMDTAPQAQFTYEQYTGQGWVQFQNQSTDLQGISYTWHFGDGDSSNLANPLHYYAADSLYTATLTVSICGFQSVVQQSILLAGLGADTPKSNTTQTIQVSPNPAKGQLHIRYQLPPNYDGNATFKLYDMMGKLVHSSPLNSSNDALSIDISQYASGVYHYQMHYQGQNLVSDKVAIIGKH
jgi:hypothetical protein